MGIARLSKEEANALRTRVKEAIKHGARTIELADGVIHRSQLNAFVRGAVGIGRESAAKLTKRLDGLGQQPTATGAEFRQRRLEFGDRTVEGPEIFTPLESRRGPAIIEADEEPAFRERIKTVLLNEYHGDQILMARALRIGLETIQKIVQNRRFAFASKVKLGAALSEPKGESRALSNYDHLRELAGSGKRTIPNTAAELVAQWEREAIEFVIARAERGE